MAVRQTAKTRWHAEVVMQGHVRIYLDIGRKVILESSAAPPRHHGFYFHEHTIAVCFYGVVPILPDVINDLLRTQRFHWIATTILRMRHYLKRCHDLLRINNEASSESNVF